MTEQTSAAEGTETSQNDTQVTKTFTQDEVNAIVARTKSQLEKKFESKFADLGDPEELRTIIEQHRKHQTEQQVKRGEFERVLQDHISRKDAEIQKRDKIIEEFKLNTPILDAAARFRAVAPDQVKSLVRNYVRLNAEGDTEIIDSEGKVRYDDSGRPLTVDAFVNEFLQKNPHFVAPTPSTTAASSNASGRSAKLDLAKLDMKNPEHRKMYAEAKRSGAI